MQASTANTGHDRGSPVPAQVPPELLEAVARALAAALVPPPRQAEHVTSGQSPDFLTAAQLAARLGVSRETVRRLAIADALPHTVVCRGTRKTTRRYPRRFAEEFAASGLGTADLAAFAAAWRARVTAPDRGRGRRRVCQGGDRPGVRPGPHVGEPGPVPRHGPAGAVMSHIGPEPGERLSTGVRRRAGSGRARGWVLIAVAAWLLALIGGGALFVSFAAQYAYILAVRRQDAASVIEALLLDLLMIVFTLLALGLSRAGQSARAERALILTCAAASSYMNVSAADVASPRSIAAYAVALAVVVDRVVAVIRRHVLADAEPSAWATLGRTAAAAARTAGLVLLYRLRFALAAPQTARGLRRMVLDATPLPVLPEPPAAEVIESPRTKKAVLLALYRAHPDDGDRSTARRVAAELAPQAGLQAGTARSYLYAELDGQPS